MALIASFHPIQRRPEEGDESVLRSKKEDDEKTHLLHGPSEHEVGLLELVGGRVLDLETLEGLGELRLDGGLLLTLDLGSNIGGGDWRTTSVLGPEMQGSSSAYW